MDWWMCQFTVAVTGSAQSVVYALKFLPQWKRCWITRVHAYTRTRACTRVLCCGTNRFMYQDLGEKDDQVRR